MFEPEMEEVNLSLFANSITVYLENPKESTKKLLKFLGDFSMILGYKVNIPKILYFYVIEKNINSSKNIIYDNIKKTLEIDELDEVVDTPVTLIC